MGIKKAAKTVVTGVRWGADGKAKEVGNPHLRTVSGTPVPYIKSHESYKQDGASTEGLKPKFTHVPRSGKLLEARGWSIGEDCDTCWCVVLCDVVTAHHGARREEGMAGAKSSQTIAFRLEHLNVKR